MTLKFTRTNRKAATSKQHKSAITDHTAKENHIINWEGASIIDRDSNTVSYYDKRGELHTQEGRGQGDEPR